MSVVQVRRYNGQNSYGPWLDVKSEAAPRWVGEYVNDERAEHRSATHGRVERGGSIWFWRAAEGQQRDPRGSKALERRWYKAMRAWGWEASLAWKKAKRKAAEGEEPPANLLAKYERMHGSGRDARRARARRTTRGRRS